MQFEYICKKDYPKISFLTISGSPAGPFLWKNGKLRTQKETFSNKSS